MTTSHVPLLFLVGTWVGEGHGEYPTIDSFDYGEEIVFEHPGRPVITVRQRAWILADSRPSHAETGFLRATEDGHAEALIAQGNGIVQVQEGTVSGQKLQLRSTTVGRSSTAKEVHEVARTFEVDGDELRYEMSMAAVGQPMTHHLRAMLRRVG
jgi:hypothetical protein